MDEVTEIREKLRRLMARLQEITGDRIPCYSDPDELQIIREECRRLGGRLAQIRAENDLPKKGGVNN